MSLSDKEIYHQNNVSKNKFSLASIEKDLQNAQNSGNNNTLEKVVRDMAHIFYDLKNGIALLKSKPVVPTRKESSYNIEEELEKVYNKQEELNKKKLREMNEKKKIEEAKRKTQNNKNIKKNPPTAQRPSSEPARKITGNNNNVVVTNNLKFPADSININSKTNSAKYAAVENTRPSSSNNPGVRKNIVPFPISREIYNPLGIIKDEVERAIRDQKTFTIKGQFPVVRRSLLRRGWIEKYHPNYRDKINEDVRRYLQFGVPELVELLRNKSVSEIIKKIIKSKLLKDHQVDLYWDHSYDAFKECPDTKKLTMINRFRRENFSYTSKQGLCQAAKEAHWLQIPGVAKINHPRCYILTKGGDTKSFLKDFGLTAAVSLLKWVVKNNITGESKIVSATGKIPMNAFDFAVTECYKFIKIVKHEDIDELVREALEIEWNEFLEQYYKIVHVGNHFKLTNKSSDSVQEAKNMVRKSNYLLNELKLYMPCMDMDGYMNIWILKPTNSSRGLGIHICRTLQFILDTIKKNPTRRYVIQKYIERPFLIHETKFDIRQWFLVSSANPLAIWMYKVCYLRFSSQTYNLRKLHESIHLTNNSVQAKYLQHNRIKDPLLPSYGMWDSKEFKSFLSDIGYPDIFDTVIYPGMRQCITGAMIAHRDKIDRRKNCFEIYGADFMISEAFEPWLLEINSNPALFASTPITARLCPEVLEDVIKVVVDHARNPRAGTGNFELIYKDKDPKYPNSKQTFEITGNPLPENYFFDVSVDEPSPVKIQETKKDNNSKIERDPGKYLLQTGYCMKEALKNLLEIVKKERQKRMAKEEKSVTVSMDNLSSYNNQTQSEVVSLFQSLTISEIKSNHSEKIVEINSDDHISEKDAEQIQEILDEIKTPNNTKQVFYSLVKVVDTLKKARKKKIK